MPVKGLDKFMAINVVEVDEVPQEFSPEIMGRKRPDVFTSAWKEVVFVGSMLVALAMAVCPITRLKAFEVAANVNVGFLHWRVYGCLASSHEAT